MDQSCRSSFSDSSGAFRSFWLSCNIKAFRPFQLSSVHDIKHETIHCVLPYCQRNRLLVLLDEAETEIRFVQENNTFELITNECHLCYLPYFRYYLHLRFRKVLRFMNNSRSFQYLCSWYDYELRFRRLNNV
jgi:hypothetical protein